MGSPASAETIHIPACSPLRIDVRRTSRRPAPQASLPRGRDSATLQAWLLALLRFAVTLAHDDRMVALAAAAELDRSGRGSVATFRFFSRASVSLCAAIADPGPAASAAVLQDHLARIDDPRLQRAFAAALGIKVEKRRAAKPAKVVDLWKGLRR
ncbi:MAG: hypothetical protein ABWY64_05330 [Tardiphaga sp.]